MSSRSPSRAGGGDSPGFFSRIGTSIRKTFKPTKEEKVAKEREKTRIREMEERLAEERELQNQRRYREYAREAAEERRLAEERRRAEERERIEYYAAERKRKAEAGIMDPDEMLADLRLQYELSRQTAGRMDRAIPKRRISSRSRNSKKIKRKPRSQYAKKTIGVKRKIGRKRKTRS